MIATVIQELPRELIESLYQSDSVTQGRPVLPRGGRETGIAWLWFALVDFDALSQHIDLLQKLSDEPFSYPRPVPISWRNPPWVPPEKLDKYRHRDPLADDDVLALVDWGPKALQNAELAKLLLNPFALYEMFLVVDELNPLTWLEVMNVSEIGQNSPVVKWPVRPMRRPDTLEWLVRHLGSILSAAASLMLGVWIGIKGFHSPEGKIQQPPQWSVTASPDFGPVRGPGQILQIKAKSNIDGFATIIVLTPNAKQDVVPGIGAEPLRVRPQSPETSTVLPPDMDHATLALVIVTETPADATVRRALFGKLFSPGQVDQLRSILEKTLIEHNYRVHAIASVAIEPANSQK